MGTPTLSAGGSWSYAASGSITPSLAAHAVGDMLIARVAYKSSAIATCDASTATSGWAKVGEFHDGTTNSGNGTGSMAVAAFWKVATATTGEAPTIDFSQTVTQVGAEARAYALGSGDTAWFTPVGDGGPDTTADTSKSMTIQSHVSVTAGDLIDFFMGIRDDCTMTVPTFTQTGATLAAVVESPAAAGIDTSGADGAYDGGYRTVSSGTSSAAAVVTGTLNTSETGAAWTTRLRSFAPEAHSGTLTATGGGIATTVRVKGGQAAATGTGGGVIASSRASQRALALTGTGGGVITRTSTSDRRLTTSATGAGVFTHTYVVESGEEHSGTLVGTGGGVAVTSAPTGRSVSVAGTGAGIAAAVAVSGRVFALTGTASGTATETATTSRVALLAGTGAGTLGSTATGAHSALLAGTGAGILVLTDATTRASSVTGTGGGIATFVGTQVESHSGILAATGGGIASLSIQSARLAAALMSGGGTLAMLREADHRGVLAATGGGILVLVPATLPPEPEPPPPEEPEFYEAIVEFWTSHGLMRGTTTLRR